MMTPVSVSSLPSFSLLFCTSACVVCGFVSVARLHFHLPSPFPPPPPSPLPPGRVPPLPSPVVTHMLNRSTPHWRSLLPLPPFCPCLLCCFPAFPACFLAHRLSLGLPRSPAGFCSGVWCCLHCGSTFLLVPVVPLCSLFALFVAFIRTGATGDGGEALRRAPWRGSTPIPELAGCSCGSAVSVARDGGCSAGGRSVAGCWLQRRFLSFCCLAAVDCACLPFVFSSNLPTLSPSLRRTQTCVACCVAARCRARLACACAWCHEAASIWARLPRACVDACLLWCTTVPCSALCLRDACSASGSLAVAHMGASRMHKEGLPFVCKDADEKKSFCSKLVCSDMPKCAIC